MESIDPNSPYARALRRDPSYQALTIENTECDANFLMRVVEMMASPYIRKVSLKGCVFFEKNYSHNPVNLALSTFMMGLTAFRHCEALDLRNSELGDQGARLLARACHQLGI